MHWNEQRTSTNWILDRIKIWSRWSKLMKYLVYLLTIVLPAIKRVAGDTFDVRVSAVQRISASAREAIKLLERGTTYFISSDLWPPNSSDLNPVNCKLWGSCNSGSIRRRMWMNSRSNRLKSGLVWSRTTTNKVAYYWHCYQRMEKTSVLLEFARRAYISNIYCRQLNNWTIG